MLPKAKSITTSLKSVTNNSSSPQGCDTAVQFVKGVGPRLGGIFSSRNIESVRDLLYFFPRAYEDRSQLHKISHLAEGVKATLAVKVLHSKQILIRKLGRSMLEVRCEDETGILNLKWFHPPGGLEKRMVPGAQLVVTGKVKIYQGKAEIIHPEMTWGVSTDAGEVESNHNVGRVVPVYTEIEEIPSRTLRKVLWEALEKYGNTLPEDIPSYLLDRWSLPSVAFAVRALHFPPDGDGFDLAKLSASDTPAHHRIIYGEFFKFEYQMLRKRIHTQRTVSTCFGFEKGKGKIAALLKMLPFQLTRGQDQALKDILEDFKEPHPMNRLVQGDVGAGKTAVAFLAAGCVLAEGGQVALMAPTEILADQHYKNALKLFNGELNVALLTGKTSSSERTQLQKRLSSGESIFLIGTHALIEDPIIFANLAFVMIDEQHRFGVEQRRALKQKGVRGGTVFPHSLILTATPIPRTLALTAFGDLAVSTIRELPPGRSPVQTQVVRTQPQKLQVYQQIKSELKAGRQAYMIYPLIYESEAEGFTQLKSAVVEAERLATKVFPEFVVGLLHGQLSPDEKTKIMERFKRGEVHLLVSTTVIEVGVDVPNVTIMVIEHAERFGLSQLHQLRGRVGRGKLQSYCFLFTHQRADGTTPQRLEVLEETHDGFKIAEADLELRGPGEFLGTRQAGGLPFRLANLVRDHEWLLRARNDAMEVMRTDPEMTGPEHLTLKRYQEREGSLESDRLGTY